MPASTQASLVPLEQPLRMANVARDCLDKVCR